MPEASIDVAAMKEVFASASVILNRSNDPPTYLIMITNEGMVAIDRNGKQAFKVNYCNTAVHSKREVLEIVNGIEYSLVMIEKEFFTVHAHCEAHGTSSGDIETFGKLLLIVRKNGVKQDHTDLNVSVFNNKFLDNGASLKMEMLNDLLDMGLKLKKPTLEWENKDALMSYLLENGISLENAKEMIKEKKRKYKIIGSWSKKALTIYNPVSSTEIAKVHPLDTKDKFMMDVDSNVNRAFVISLIAAVDCMKGHNMPKLVTKVGGVGLKVVAGLAAVATIAREAPDIISS